MPDVVSAGSDSEQSTRAHGRLTVRALVWFYIAILWTVVAILVLVSASRAAHLWAPALPVLVCLALLGYSIRQEHAGARVAISFTMIILAAAIVLVGPLGALIVGAISTLLTWRPDRAQVRAFNSAMHGVVGGSGGLSYVAFGGIFPIEGFYSPLELLLRVGLPLMGANVVMSVVNALLLGGVIRLNDGDRVLRFAVRTLATSGPAYIGYGLIAFLFVVLWKPAGVNAFSAVLVLAPLFVARWALGQYGDEQRVHERTIGALVAAVEANDPYTLGHSERMATLCGLIGDRLSLGFQRADELRFAALLHDVGTIALPWQTLRHSGPLTPHDLDEIQQHPAVGVAMVQEIEFLQESCPGILHHHERFDGRGYPAGLAGEDIPEYARIIAVADAFDSMTTSRSYRPAMSMEQALAELRARAGSQFDPRMVSALEEALRGRGWEPTVLSPAVLATAGDAHDHDDPVVSDLIASSPMSGHPLEHRDPG